MQAKKRSRPPKTLWAYGYQIVPSCARSRLRAVTALLDEEHAAALLGSRRWKGEIVIEKRITYILVVSDNPRQNRPVNRRLENELKALKLGFSLTVPLAVPPATAA